MPRKLWTRATVVVVVALIAGGALAAYGTATEFLASNQRVTHSHQVMQQLDLVLSTLLDAETGQRGYVITGRPEYLEPYEAARAELDQVLASLRALVADDATELAQTANLESLVKARMAALENNVGLRQSRGLEAAQDAMLSGAGKRLMDAVREKLAAMQAAEARLLGERERHSARDLGRFKVLLVLVSLLIVALVAVAASLVERDLGRAERHLDAAASARRRSVAALHDRTEQTRAIVDSVVDAIITIDESGIIQTVNAATERLFGYPAVEMIRQNVSMLMPPPYRDEHDRYLAAYRATHIAKIIGIGREVTARRKDGTTFPVDLAVSEAMVDQRRLFTGVVRDLTDRKRVEAEMNELHRRVQERARLADMGAVTAQIVHDLGNPIAGVSMQVQRLVRTIRRNPDEPAANMATIGDQILRNIGRLDGLLNELRDFSRQQRLELTDLDPVRLLTAAGELWRPVAAARGIHIRIEVAETAPPIVADEAKLLRVLDNLTKNAIEAIGQGPGEVRLTIGVNDSPQRPVRISVSDTGSGIPETVDVFRLFETTKANGSGLGLPIARRIIEAHGGGLTFARREPHGTVFHIDLPSRPRSGPAG